MQPLNAPTIPRRGVVDRKVLANYRKIAKATMNEARVKILLRLTESDLLRLKAKALREGLPYQTLIGSILHKAVSG